MKFSGHSSTCNSQCEQIGTQPGGLVLASSLPWAPRAVVKVLIWEEAEGEICGRGWMVMVKAGVTIPVMAFH